jgi:16S rRNA (guanine527-N7)-methyltransferase
MAMKGKTPAKELKELHGVLFHVEPLGVPFLEAERCIVWMRPNE